MLVPFRKSHGYYYYYVTVVLVPLLIHFITIYKSLFITVKVINVGSGDFNRDVLNNSNRHLTSILSQCKLIVTKPSLIYHVYASNHSLYKLCWNIKHSFSDHNAYLHVWLKFLNLVQKWGEGGTCKKAPPTNFSREISTNAAITPQDFLHFNFNFFATLA